jgi:hypothetical protein
MMRNWWMVVPAALTVGFGLGCGDGDEQGSGGAGGTQAGKGGQGGSGGSSAGSSSKGGSAGSAAGSGGSTAGSGGSGGGGNPTDLASTPECMAWCDKLLTECAFECDPSFDCEIGTGQCFASELDYLDCAINEGQLSCGADGFAVIGCGHDESLCN